MVRPAVMIDFALASDQVIMRAAYARRYRIENCINRKYPTII